MRNGEERDAKWNMQLGVDKDATPDVSLLVEINC
jgi:hypothetical protein